MVREIDLGLGRWCKDKPGEEGVGLDDTLYDLDVLV